ncbi:MAG: hypothetical protein IPL61_26780 [Myxococcales bacterium]|nr:hypothetical protein [Myxococcales bacterium]
MNPRVADSLVRELLAQGFDSALDGPNHALGITRSALPTVKLGERLVLMGRKRYSAARAVEGEPAGRAPAVAEDAAAFLTAIDGVLVELGFEGADERGRLWRARFVQALVEVGFCVDGSGPSGVQVANLETLSTTRLCRWISDVVDRRSATAELRLDKTDADAEFMTDVTLLLAVFERELEVALEEL